MTSLLVAPSDLRGAQQPRIRSVPEYASSAGAEALEVAELAGLFLYPWQQLVIVDALAERPDGKWAAPTVGLVVPRQNGKGSILEARELAGLFLLGEEVIIHSAHEQGTASEQFRRLLNLIEGVPEFERRILKVVKGKGSEAIELRGGQRIFFRTRTSGGGRGFTCDLLIYDEAMILPDAFITAVSPTLAARSLSTRTGVQTWYTGSAVDQTSSLGEHGVAFSRIRNQGLKANPAVAFFEWSLDLDDPSRVDYDTLNDPEAWALTNPSLGLRISPEYIERELLELGERGFAVERLSIGDWPDPTGESSRLIPLAAWRALTDPDSVIAGPGVIAIDVAPDSTAATIAGGGRRSDGLIHVGVIDHGRGTHWVADRLAELDSQLHPTAIIADSGGAVDPLLPEIERAGVTLTRTNSKEFAQACGMLANSVRNQSLRHPGNPEMVTAIADARTKPLAEAWKWDRRAGGDISALVASSLVVWGLEQAAGPTEIHDLNEVVARMRAEGRL
jgi:hypothetical protein